MTPHDLLANIETLAEAPNGIQRLRELVLELGVRGKLVEQDPEDEPASSLLKKIQNERNRATKSPKKAMQGGSEPTTDGRNSRLPEGWLCIRLEECIELISGQHLGPTEYHTEEKGLPYLTGPADFGARTPTPSRWTFETRAVAQKGDILVTVKGAGIGKSNVLDSSKAAISRQLMAVRPVLVDREFTYLLIRASFLEFQSKQVGIAIPGIGREDILRHQVLLPPLGEQRRIVARVDELMALLDRLEAKRQDREAARTAARDSALAALREAPTPDEVETAWLRIQDQFHELFVRPEDVEPVRALVLDLAIHGKVVDQDSTDEPVLALLNRIKAERATLIRAKKIRAGKPLPPIVEADLPFNIPSSWTWARLADIGDWGAGATPTRGISTFYGGDINWFKSGELTDGSLAGPSRETITPLALAKFSLRENQPGDVLIALYGATIGKLAILNSPGTTNQAICGCTCFADTYNRYLFLFLMAWRRRFIAQGEGGAQPNISKEKVVATLFPLPPLPEQHRIVARVDELMTLLDRLSESLTSHQTFAGAFASAAVHHLEV